MARIAPTRETLIALFAKSGNVCAFPGCTHELVTSRNIFVGQVCHIEAANQGGQRFNPNSTDEQRRSFENLLCCATGITRKPTMSVSTTQTPYAPLSISTNPYMVRSHLRLTSRSCIDSNQKCRRIGMKSKS